VARARTAGTFVVAEVPPIPFPDHSFDFVVCFETVEHIEDDGKFMREIRRVLRPAGQLLLSTPNAEVSAPGQSVANRWHVREYTFTSLGALLDAAGLTVAGCHAQGFPPLISRGHRLAWRLSGLTDALPAAIARPARTLLGDATVRPLDDRVTIPGFWVVRASVTHPPAAHGPAPGDR
jgi:SAM-dependent methyltransferase